MSYFGTPGAQGLLSLTLLLGVADKSSTLFCTFL